MTRKTIAWIAAGAAVAAVAVWMAVGAWSADRYDPGLDVAFRAVVEDNRKVLVLADGAEALDDAARARALATAWKISRRRQGALDEVTRRLTEEYRGRRAPGVRQLVRFLGAAGGLRDLDKLAFLDLVDQLDALGARRDALAGEVKALHENLNSIHLGYRQEVTRVFSEFATRGPGGSRDKWDADIGKLKSGLSRDAIFAEAGAETPEEPEGATRGADGAEIFGSDFAPQTVALTFDDGPHPRYTEQVLALLAKYGVRACFFELGENLGVVQAAGKVTLLPTAKVAQKVIAAGHVVANHSYSHPVLPKLPEAQRVAEIEKTSLLLEKVSGHKPELFRAPYGARNKAILDELAVEKLRSVMWGVDSLDWADPIPESIAMRVLHALSKTQKGIILFHDIHKQSVMALPQVIEELQRQQYEFLSFSGGKFGPAAAPVAQGRAVTAPASAPVPAGGTPQFYRESWAVIIGINEYASWPKLRYAVNDASALEETLVTRFGFKRENIRKLVNGEATRQRILQVLGDEFTNPDKVRREDRVLVFFAGHGATRTLADGRQIGFIVPVDADRQNYYSTAISMSSLRDACDLIAAKHIYFIMDSCYSGLALSRGGGAFARDHTYLEEVTRRVSRQILTAGGADQQVADDGPGGHSIFTWALLQGLQGQADMDGNGVITASELGAYISPIVAQFSKQTPTVGNLVGSEGGEFLFELKPEALTGLTRQFDKQTIQLNEKLASLQQQIAARQSELLKLQHSIQAETVKLAQLTRTGDTGGRAAAESPVRTPARPRRAGPFDLDRQGQLLYRERKYAEALAKFQEAVALKPGDPVLLNNLGFLYYQMDRYDDAVTWLRKTLEADPRRKEAHGNIAYAYLKLGRKQEARAEFEQYLAIYPKAPKAGEIRKILAELK